ncbi:hypothetical protein ACVGW6_00255, partial [Enterobacter intestinihominis]
FEPAGLPPRPPPPDIHFNAPKNAPAPPHAFIPKPASQTPQVKTRNYTAYIKNLYETYNTETHNRLTETINLK